VELEKLRHIVFFASAIGIKGCTGKYCKTPVEGMLEYKERLKGFPVIITRTPFATKQ
jgi:hypothetical protein